MIGPQAFRRWVVALPIALAMLGPTPGRAADAVLNEFNAVGRTNFLPVGGTDSRFGRRAGNGGDWFEWVVIADHLDVRGWQFEISHRTGVPVFPGPGEEIQVLTLSNDPIWSDLRAGTIVTISEDYDATARDYRPEVGEWWINVRASDVAGGRYVTPINFPISNEITQITILDELGDVVFGPAGEGISPANGIGSTEVFRLEGTPSSVSTPFDSLYGDGDSSSFGLPNEWTDATGTYVQDLSALRSVVPYHPLTTVVVNEVNVHSDPPDEDWIELHNRTPGPIDLGGWFLSDGKVNLTQYQIPQGTFIPANGYLVFYESALPFSLNGQFGESVYLSEGDGLGGMTGGRDYVDFGPLENGVTFGRFPNAVGPFHRLETPTPGFANSNADFGPIVINEVMYHAPDPAPPGLGAADLEYVELRNNGSVDAPLAVDYGAQGIFPWRLAGVLDLDFPATAFVPANGFVLAVNFDPAAEPLKLDAFRTHYGVPLSVPIYGPSGGRLGNYTDKVNLRRPDEPSLGIAPRVLRDSVTYSDFGDWPEEADGAGSSLERIDPTLALSDAERWAPSLVVGGTPGAENTVLSIPEPSMTSQWIFGVLASAMLHRRRRRSTKSGASVHT